MTRTRSRFGLVATLLAFCALLAMNALTGWHAADAHVDRPAIELAGETGAEHTHEADNDELDHAVHGAAHAANQPFDLAVGALQPGPLGFALRSWTASDAFLHAGVAPTALIRPPRA